LLDRVEHEESCNLERGLCDGCSWSQFHAWLDEPVLVSDRRAAERKRERLELLKRGEVPA
jgi:hypothetical protein